MFSKFKVSEILIIILTVVLIFVSEYYFVILKNPMRAIFISISDTLNLENIIVDFRLN